jgi:CRISPR-associated protein Cas2
MDLLVTYDVNTLTKEGRSRLRKVARVCENFGQRVQESVFEVSVTEAQKIRFVYRLQQIIEEKEDSLRIYQLRGPREQIVETYGLDRYVNFKETLVI